MGTVRIRTDHPDPSGIRHRHGCLSQAQVCDVTKRSRIIEHFWKELVDRIEDGDVEEDSLIQVGAFVGKHGYCLRNSNIKIWGKKKHLQNEE